MNHEKTIILYRPLLEAIAYNLVRCKADAEDIVQETFLKWLTLGPQKIENTKAYLIKAVKNNCINHLNALRKKKEELFNQHNLSELLGRFKETSFAHLDFDVEMAKAYKILQAKLEPLERAVYVLKEVFDFDYEALQEALDKKKDHCRQLFCRAKKKLAEETSKINFELPDTSKFVESFRKACYMGNAVELVNELQKEGISDSIKKS
ncbi:sigma-70 family RNA polymerase sigma factor [Chryseolinea sp. H1M3-3]|uniref:sigma-70 family RNA polymerase sigma factor n=1 Tax=Chryseolinea sp. H1M3-3 TaxID=3034144 RepID=UPI0023ECA60E|nr:sigma-70 family RNA polymerase sigma factor [Chryseolinea sp. H1M3-3]